MRSQRAMSGSIRLQELDSFIQNPRLQDNMHRKQWLLISEVCPMPETADLIIAVGEKKKPISELHTHLHNHRHDDPIFNNLNCLCIPRESPQDICLECLSNIIGDTDKAKALKSDVCEPNWFPESKSPCSEIPLIVFSPLIERFAKYIYENRDFKSMPIMADAIEDWWDQQENKKQIDIILDHARNHPHHVRGCWLLDYLIRF